jgi:uncharacterized protein
MIFHGNTDHLFELVKNKLENSGSCHDFDHTRRVIGNAKLLLDLHPDADKEIVLLAALLHDIARPEEEKSRGTKCHAAMGAEMVPDLLKKCGFPDDIIPKVAEAVRTHRFRIDDPPQSLEAQVVYDADKLDSLGAVGIGRAFLFAGRAGARLHNTAEEALNSPAYSAEDTAYREYLVKLRYIPEKMFTTAGRSIAAGRLEYMEKFFSELESELH